MRYEPRSNSCGPLCPTRPSVQSAVRSEAAAFFDVDGTLFRGNVVRHYLGLTMPSLSHWERRRILLGMLSKVPVYWLIDRVSRSRFLGVMYRNYRGLPLESLRLRGRDYFDRSLRPRLFAAALRQIAWHQRHGQGVVLVTGSPDFVVAPLAEQLGASASLVVELDAREGICTGEVVGEPLVGEAKARAIRRFAEQSGINLSASFAYGDSSSDRAMLETVGHPIAVNPDGRLRRLAGRRGWPVFNWK